MGARDILEAEQYDKTKNAIDHIGVAALPFLVRWLQYEPPEWRSRLSGWFSRTDFPLAGQLSDLIIQPRALQLAVGTPSAFQILGKRAAPALDDLCRLMNDTNSPYTANQAAETLASLGTNALPALLAVATNAQHPARGEALAAIGAIDDLGDTARLAVPVLTNCLTDTNSQDVQLIAIATLRNLKSCAQFSVPALASCLTSKNPTTRMFAAAALAEFGPRAISAIPALTNALATSDPFVYNSATAALHQIDPGTFTNDPAAYRSTRPAPPH
jgi:HEAT repeat protein